MKTTDRLKLQLKRKLPAILCAVFIVALVGLYYLGVYDVSFLQRPEGWENNIDRLYEVLFGKEEESEDIPAETEPAETDKQNNSYYNEGDGPSSGNSSTQQEFSTVSALQEQGWVLTDAVYSADTCQFALLETPYALPGAFSYTDKTYDKEELIYYEDGTEAERQVVRATAQRPALELYMGYILYDDRGTLYILGPDGTPAAPV